MEVLIVVRYFCSLRPCFETYIWKALSHTILDMGLYIGQQGWRLACRLNFDTIWLILFDNWEKSTVHLQAGCLFLSFDIFVSIWSSVCVSRRDSAQVFSLQILKNQKTTKICHLLSHVSALDEKFSQIFYFKFEIWALSNIMFIMNNNFWTIFI